MNILRDKQLYKSYITQHESIPVFNQPFWLDAVCGDKNWQVVLITDNNEIVAAMPYYIKKKYIFEIITTPKHTQRFSPCIKYPQKIKTYSHKVDFENKVMTALLSAFPKEIYFQSTFHFDYQNALPFYWSGYKVNYRHTYVIDDISSPEEVFNGFSNNRKRVIRRAKKNITVKDDLTPERFYKLHQESLKQKKSNISYSFVHFKKIYNACKENECGKIFHAIDDDMNLHAALYIIWDNKAAYHLIPVVNPNFYKSQAISLLVFNAIEYLQDKTSSYDFEGSMMINIEKAYREYGALPKPFFNIEKSKSRLIKRAFCL